MAAPWGGTQFFRDVPYPDGPAPEIDWERLGIERPQAIASASSKLGREWRDADEHLAMLANADKTVEMARGLEECVRILTPQVQLRTPVATGRLRESIKGETRVTARGALQGVVWTNVFYSLYQERGTYASRAGGHRAGRAAYRGHPGRFFFQGAWEANRGRCERILDGAYAKIVRHWKGGRVRA